MPTTLTNSALIYTCAPDRRDAMASLQQLTTETENELGYTVRAAVGDTAPLTASPTNRAGWAEFVVPLITARSAGILVVPSVRELSLEALERATLMDWLHLHDVTVTSLRPSGWETEAWLDRWLRETPQPPRSDDNQTASDDSGDRVCRFAFAADRHSVGPARTVIADRLRAWCPARQAEDAITAGNELLTNAVIHGSGYHPDPSVTVMLERHDRELRMSVADTSPIPPTPRNATPGEQSGRGLFMVAALTDRWGCEPLPDRQGKQVWASLQLPALGG
ncbi:ATP-binding protein [Streptomyces sp. NPDC004726]